VKHSTLPQVDAPGTGAAAEVTSAARFVRIDLTALVKRRLTDPRSNYGVLLAPASGAPATSLSLDAKEDPQSAHEVAHKAPPDPGGACWVFRSTSAPTPTASFSGHVDDLAGRGDVLEGCQCQRPPVSRAGDARREEAPLRPAVAYPGNGAKPRRARARLQASSPRPRGARAPKSRQGEGRHS
jgi:hypothetical protein